MNAPAAISGTFVKIEPVATRKVVRLHVECPIEEANQILAALGGYPDPANPAHVAVARLAAAPHDVIPADKRRLSELPPSSQAALTCQREAFWKYLRDEQGVVCDGEDDAATFVRKFCDVNTRAALVDNERARSRWMLLLSGYQSWMNKP